SAPSAASRRRASCAVPRVAVKWTSAGATAPAAGARRASNDRRTVGLSDGRTVNTHPIAVIGGDGIGPEVIEAAIPVLERAAAKYGFGLELERLPYSADHYLKTRETLPDHAFRHLQDDVDAIFIGAAFEWAQARGKMRVTMSDKANAVPAHKVWQETFKRVAAAFPGIEAEHRYVDALALELVREPERFQVIVTNNLYGDILSDLG